MTKVFVEQPRLHRVCYYPTVAPLKATSLHHSYNLCFSRENDSGAGFDHWYNECFEPMEPPPITWAELLPSLTVYS